jgi:hypothetical protein
MLVLDISNLIWDLNKWFVDRTEITGLKESTKHTFDDYKIMKNKRARMMRDMQN